jgi:ribonuclease HI
VSANETWRVRLEDAVESFNESESARTVRGLTRTLGRPRVSVGAAAGSPQEVRITVAWELTWYQWGVDLGSPGRPVCELAQGGELSELEGSARVWNGGVGEGGRVYLGEFEPLPPSRVQRLRRALVRVVVNVDGGARGNPGPAAIAAVVQDEGGEVLEESAERIGPATNNVAEYRALLLGIERAAAIGATDLDLVGDSELIVRQVKGDYKVKDAALRELHGEVLRALGPFRSWSIRHVRRERNSEADRLVNEALDGA